LIALAGVVFLHFYWRRRKLRKDRDNFNRLPDPQPREPSPVYGLDFEPPAPPPPVPAKSHPAPNPFAGADEPHMQETGEGIGSFLHQFPSTPTSLPPPSPTFYPKRKQNSRQGSPLREPAYDTDPNPNDEVIVNPQSLTPVRALTMPEAAKTKASLHSMHTTATTARSRVLSLPSSVTSTGTPSEEEESLYYNDVTTTFLSGEELGPDPIPVASEDDLLAYRGRSTTSLGRSPYSALPATPNTPSAPPVPSFPPNVMTKAKARS
jgi:hypothetical protein